MASTNGMNSVSEYAQFYNSDNHDRVYDADSMAEWLTPFFVDGIFNGQMQVTANDDMTVSVAPGFGYIDGKVKHFPASTILNISNAHAQYRRIDLVVLRRDDTDRDFELDILEGAPAQNPVPPALTRNNTIWELQLAKITIPVGATSITQSAIEDTRMDSSVCGWVAATVEEIDFDQIKAQFDAWFDEYQAFVESENDDFVATMNQYQQDFLAWFDRMKGQLSTDAAGNLQLQIDTINDELDATREDIAKISDIDFDAKHAVITVTTSDPILKDNSRVWINPAEYYQEGQMVNGSCSFTVDRIGAFNIGVKSYAYPTIETSTSITITGFNYEYKTSVSFLGVTSKSSWNAAQVGVIKDMLKAHKDGIIDVKNYWTIGESRQVQLYASATLDLITAGTKGTESVRQEHAVSMGTTELTLVNKGGRYYSENNEECAFVGMLRFVGSSGSEVNNFAILNNPAKVDASYSYNLNITNPTGVGYKDSLLRTNFFNSALISVFEQVGYDGIFKQFKNKTIRTIGKPAGTQAEVIEVDDYFSLLAESEIIGESETSKTYVREGTQLKYFESTNNRKLKSGGLSSGLRTPYIMNVNQVGSGYLWRKTDGTIASGQAGTSAYNYTMVTASGPVNIYALFVI